MALRIDTLSNQYKISEFRLPYQANNSSGERELSLPQFPGELRSEPSDCARLLRTVAPEEQEVNAFF